MSTKTDTFEGKNRAVSAPQARGRKLGIATWVIALTRFMVVLDGTIMIVAIPSIQRSLNIPASHLDWVINTYSLTFGGMMLAAGLIGDVLGRKKVFRVGLALFGLASLLGGLSHSGMALILFRGFQGIGAAIATPGALSLLVTTFAEGQPRNRALGIYGAATGMASVIGLLLGGVLSTYLGWRWVLFVNVPVTITILLGVGALVEGDLQKVKVDLFGAITATLGIGLLVFAVNRVGEHGWSDLVVLWSLALALIVLVAFLIIQRVSTRPMIPRVVLNERGRVGANILTFIVSAGMFATYYFLTLYMQEVLGYSALRTGMMFLPLAAGFGVGAGAIGPRLLKRTSERAALCVGLMMATAGTVWFSFLTTGSSIFAILVPASVVAGLGLGATTVVATSVGIRGIDISEAGIGSSLLTASGQVGGALGLAVLATIATATTRHMEPGTATKVALTAGYASGFMVAAVFHLASLIVNLLMIRPMMHRWERTPSS